MRRITFHIMALYARKDGIGRQSMFRLLVALLVCLLVLPEVASAQDGDEPQCIEENVSAAIDHALAQLREAKAQDISTALATLGSVRSMLAELDAQCRGLAFSGTTGVVHGPVTVPEGIYRIIVTADRYFIMSSLVLEGACSHGFADEVAIFNEMQGEAGEFAAEKIFKSEGCSALFETSNIQGPYTVTFEKIQ